MEADQVIQLDIGERFKSQEYTLLKKTGQGGFGSVYKAKKQSTGQVVAIKLLNLSSELDDAKRQRYINLFHRETALSSLLQHPNIVRLLDKGVCDQGVIYAVFEYIQGKSLKEVLQEEVLAPSLVANIMGQVLSALGHAHDNGVIHRDLKPANIMLEKIAIGYHARVLDFGIATLTHEARHLGYQTITINHETLGTPNYCAPEQLRGEPPTIKSDLYMWGLVFVECLTGEPAIRGSSLAAVFHQQLSQTSVSLPIWISAHPVAVLLRGVLNKKSQERAGNASSIYLELEKLNFSSMVGGVPLKNRPSIITKENDFNQTQVNIQSLQYTVLSERKPISVLCISLAINSAAGNEVDLEVIEALHRDQKVMCIDIAARYSAFHAGTLGDTLLFYFGYPLVSDNDCRLCARTALEISSRLSKRNALLKLSQGVEVNARMGMHSGLVTHYSDMLPEGEVINIAMELARLATSRQVRCTESSKILLDSYIEFNPDQKINLGVNRQPVFIYQMLGERIYESMGLLRSLSRDSNFIGREIELRKIETVFKQTHSTPLIHLFGEPGIGKSRVLLEIKALIPNNDYLFCQCLPEQKFSGLFPIICLLRNRYSLEALTGSEALLKLQTHFKLAGGENEDTAIPLLCSWLNIPLPINLSIAMAPAEEQKEILFDAIILLLFKRGDSNKRLIFVFEDMHWADPTSLEFVGYLVSHKKFISFKSAFISTSRQELSDLLSKEMFTNIRLLRLDNDKANQLIRDLFNQKNVSNSVLEVVNSRADGIPLYIEELVKMLKGSDITQHLNGVLDFMSPSYINEIPETLLGSLQQKLDGLVNAKETAQLASAIGRTFEYKLLVLASIKSEEQVQCDLDELVAQEVIYQQRHISGDRYIFKHALVRDAAYKGIGKGDLIRSHLNIAQCMEMNFTDISSQTPSVVADHYAKAQDFLGAVRFGKQTVYEMGKTSLNQQALKYAELVGGWLEQLINDQVRIELRLQLNSIILPIKTMYQGWGDLEVKLLAEDNLKIISEIEQGEKSNISIPDLKAYQHKSRWIIFINNHLQSNRVIAKEQGEALLNEALLENNRQNELVVRSILGQIYYFDAQFDKAKRNFERSISLYDNKLDQYLYIEYVIDPYLFSSGNLLLIESIIGNKELADHYCQLCMNYAKATKNIANIATAYTFGCLKYFIFSDRKGLNVWAKTALEKYGDKLKSSWIYDFFYMLYEWSERGYTRSEQTVKEQISKGQSGILSWYEPSLADSYITNKMYDQAIILMQSSIDRALQSGESCILPLSYRYLAKAQYLKSGFLCKDSAGNYDKAITLARSSGTGLLEFNALKEYQKYLVDDNLGASFLPEMKLMSERLAALGGYHNDKEFFTVRESDTPA